jgi:hypothetical protein
MIDTSNQEHFPTFEPQGHGCSFRESTALTGVQDCIGAGPIASTARSNRCAIALVPLRVTTLLVSLNRLLGTVFRARLRIQPAVHLLRRGRRGGRALRRGGGRWRRVDVARPDGRLAGERRPPVPRDGTDQPGRARRHRGGRGVGPRRGPLAFAEKRQPV